MRSCCCIGNAPGMQLFATTCRSIRSWSARSSPWPSASVPVMPACTGVDVVGLEAIVMTRGVYAWIRHPLYLAFLAMLVSTGLLAPPGLGTVVSIVTYLAGSELRIAAEEQELSNS